MLIENHPNYVSFSYQKNNESDKENKVVIERNRFFGFGQNRNRNQMGFGKPKPKLKPKLTPNI